MKAQLATLSISIISIFVATSQATLAEDAAPAKIAVGDKWVYQETDNITKSPTRTITWVVTETADKTYTITANTSKDQHNVDLYDYNGNGVEYNDVTYAPNDGTGLPPGAKPGTTWKQSYTWRNSQKGNGGKARADGKCDSNEQVTTPAGTFDTLKCTVTLDIGATTGGVKEREIVQTSWYSPKTLRPVQREVVNKEHGHLASDVTQQLTEYHLGD